ncbi:hypothetical protein D3C87_1695100 [compost metagenome]
MIASGQSILGLFRSAGYTNLMVGGYSIFIDQVLPVGTPAHFNRLKLLGSKNTICEYLWIIDTCIFRGPAYKIPIHYGPFF